MTGIALQELEEIISQRFPNATTKITDLAGDNNHYQLEISDPDFKGLSIIKQHRAVNDKLKDLLAARLHALTIKITTPK